MTETGLDILLHSEKNKKPKTAVLTNQTGLGADGTQNIDLLIKAGFNISAILVPEHGLRGVFNGGEKMADHVDPHYGIPVISLYNERLSIDPEKLRGIKRIIYDIQDVGARFYTYIATLKALMTSISDSSLDIQMVVADRPAFLGDTIQGLMPVKLSFLSPEHIPVRYGLTCGEFAAFTAKYNDLDIDLEVVKIPDYRRGTDYVDYGLPFVPPSSAIKDPESAMIYLGTCLLEGTDLSEGRGTDTPFKVFGRDDLQGIDAEFQGMECRKIRYTPRFNKFKGSEIEGFRLKVTDKNRIHPFRDMVLFLMDLHAESPISFRLPHFDMLAGGPLLRELIEDQDKERFLSLLKRDEVFFADKIEEFRLYR